MRLSYAQHRTAAAWLARRGTLASLAVFESTPMTGCASVRVCPNAAPDHETLRRALMGLRGLLQSHVV